MIGLDTNVVVRYVAQDHVVESRTATRIIEKDLSTEEPGFVSVVVMAELAWVLERSYELTQGEVASTIERMLSAEGLVVECEQEVFTAMTATGRPFDFPGVRSQLRDRLVYDRPIYFRSFPVDTQNNTFDLEKLVPLERCFQERRAIQDTRSVALNYR
jgi:predicted nucleic-acid-binding protein